MTKATASRLEKAQQAIGAVDLKNIVKKAAQNYGWKKKQAADAELWYRRYLFLCFKYKGESIAAIGKDADLLWHQHIIDTAKYAADCKSIFGYFLQHTPVYGKPNPTERDSFDKAKALYKTEFGGLPISIRLTSGNYSYMSSAPHLRRK